MYSTYISFIQQINSLDLSEINFKSNAKYNDILEHVSFKLGQDYITLIENEFSYITYEILLQYVNMNDLYGKPKKETMRAYGRDIICSPTSVRYMYHALVILHYYKSTPCRTMAEVGCGYGGLFLAICFLSKRLNIPIEKYHMIDLPEVGTLITNYLKLHTNDIHIPFSVHDANQHGSDVNSEDLFFISNYCFTEIDLHNRNEYMNKLVNRTTHGFITWQTIFDHVPIQNVQFCKPILKIMEERPQTASAQYKNYFVFF